ncbi:MAG: M28 family peptidase, partial [Acidobacteria bacterium]|nr:M28 family peptidase [Acidobacteriota bacterium]
MFRLRALFLLIAVAAPAADMSLTLLPNTELRAPLQGIPARDAERGQRLSALFRARGCAEPRLEQQQFSKRKPPNVVCTLPGESTEQIVVGAHFDTVAGSAGVLDNWAGAAMLPALYATLSAQPRRYTYVFVGFSSEEDGLIGSREYVNQIPKESRGNVRAMVNLDCMGAGTTKVGYSRS